LSISCIQVQAVSKYGSFTNQSMLLIHVQVTLAPRKQLLDELDFIPIFGQMGMHIGIRILVGKAAGGG
jgi:hypothetical protein